MLILQSGMAKSGNFWLYRILKNILDSAKLEQKSFIQSNPIYEVAKTWPLSFDEQAGIDVIDVTDHGCFYRISHIFRYPIEDIQTHLNQCRHVWTHSPMCSMSFQVFSYFDKIVYIVRDPRDVAISMAKFAFTPYSRRFIPHNEPDFETFLAKNLPGMTEYWVQHVGNHLLNKGQLNIYFVFYERLLADFDNELCNLLGYLDIQLDTEEIERIRQNVAFDAMKARNPCHVRQGKAGGWANTLTRTQQKQVVKVSGQLLDLLNYPLDLQQKTSRLLPELPDLTESNRSTIQKVLDSRIFPSRKKRIAQLLLPPLFWKTASVRRIVVQRLRQYVLQHSSRFS